MTKKAEGETFIEMLLAFHRNQLSKTNEALIVDRQTFGCGEAR